MKWERKAMLDFPAKYLFLLFPVFFVLMWMVTLFTISMIGGWRSLAASFEATRPPRGRKFSMQSLLLGRFTGYNNCVKVHLSEDGLDVRLWRLFSFGHRPLLIPWSELHDPQPKRFLWSKNVTFRVGGPNGQKLSISEKLYQEAKPFLEA